jgi:aldehyde oxidoreductase
MTIGVPFVLNGREVTVEADPAERLADVLRSRLGATGTKVGCNAGDCGACTVRLDGAQVCACLVPVAQVRGRTVETVEGLAGERLSALQRAFHRHGAAQCGICTPGMLMAATDLLARELEPTRSDVEDALGGVLCRCTGYAKIVEAVLDVASDAAAETAPAGGAVGFPLAKVDGLPKLDGTERYGADTVPPDALWLRVIRSPHAAASFELGDLDGFVAAREGLERALTAADVPFNGFGIYPHIKDQPVLAEKVVLYRGQAVIAILGSRAALDAIDPAEVPIAWTPTEPVMGIEAAMAEGAMVQPGRENNLLIEGMVRTGHAGEVLDNAAFVAEGTFETGFVEHAYIEPEAGWASRGSERIELRVSTQTPYMDRDEVANVMRIAPEQVRVVPSACGGGFGGKLDQGVQPLVALAAWLTGRTVACVWTRPESMMASTKRHPSRVQARFGCDGMGRLEAAHVTADFDTGAFASWGPTVAGRVPVHASGPYRVPNVMARGRAWFSNGPPAGAFRGFGVPQAAIAHETLMDDLALQVKMDRLEFRLLNALEAGDRTATGQKLATSVGMRACLEALTRPWKEALSQAATFNGEKGHLRRGVGIGCMWYGIGNTSMSNPSTMTMGVKADGTVTLYSGAFDIGQGSNTVMTQIAADALGIAADRVRLVTGDTDRTADAGKTSASRQTLVSGRAAEAAAMDLRTRLLRLANAGKKAVIEQADGGITLRDGGASHRLDLAALEADANGDVLVGSGTFDPPTTPLNASGQGNPYAAYAFAAQMAVVEVDTELGTVKVVRMIAAHDVGKAVNPTQVEGQIHGGIAQGLGLALMEEYIPGRTENLHDYLIPTFGDMPQIDVIIIEDPEPHGPFGAKGVGEPGLVATAPAILSAIRHACGARLTRVPALPHRVLAAMRAGA